MRPILQNIKRLEIAVIIILALIISLSLYKPPIIGVANNGDFYRIFDATGLSFIDDLSKEPYAAYIHTHFSMKVPLFNLSPYYIVSQRIPIFIAKLLNYVFISKTVFDIRALSFVYLIIFLFAIYLIIRFLKTGSSKVNIIMCIFLILMLSDNTYIAYFNSFYGEPSGFVYLLLFLGTALWFSNIKDLKISHLILLFGSSALFFGAKLQYMILSPVLIVLIPPLVKLRGDKKWRIAVFCMVFFLILFNFTLYFCQPRGLDYDTTFNSVFYGILKKSPDVQKDLKALVLDNNFSVLASRNAFEDNLPIDIKSQKFKEFFYNKMSKFKIIKFYLTHPLRFISGMNYTATLAFNNMTYPGSFEKSAGLLPQQVNKFFTFYNRLRNKLVPKSLLFIVPFYLLYGILAIKKYLSEKCSVKKFRISLILMLLLIGIIEFPLPYVGNGEADVAKQLFMYNLSFDLSIITAIYQLLKWARSNAPVTEKLLHN